ncbi:MAG: aminotransferase class I/II-fold pyridoxal phosphate-dependent enzyme [Candidatus Eisenbacteria bacterium]|uniref:Aminotransferase class I/II-fold pyridoxal phosphate-dependent enzyme n=1 Tax=Eiseniibacteriota bacterium TaxID=2212470 RepID=A0A849SW67_UNCEI|nr:aminotransferase class I/II-fold pyridoxal phosphate-dependent enzyme [Candidatus Eisenbacteria bacterium]
MSPTSPIVDLRSDTVTRPTPAMRRAMAEAVVGDDVFGDDPTVQALERRVAELSGKEAAVYVPSGTMGNQLAIATAAGPGDAAVMERESHIFLYEQGGLAANSGVLAHTVAGARGALAVADLTAALRGEDEHVARVRLVCVENTHNRAGGVVVPLAELRSLSEVARSRGLGVHLDGARLWNASVASGIPIREWAAIADTVMMCFSKGLGAPIGSILIGPAERMLAARRVRKRWGGAMRQVGILAAACLHALDHHVERLADDHRRARSLAAGFRETPGVRVPEPDTNIVIVELEHPALDPTTVLEGLAERGVWMVPFGTRRLRAIAHLDVDDAGVEQAIAAWRAVAGGAVHAAG